MVYMTFTIDKFNALPPEEQLSLVKKMGIPIFRILKKGRTTILFKVFSYFINVRFKGKAVEYIRALFRYQDWDGYNAEEVKKL